MRPKTPAGEAGIRLASGIGGRGIARPAQGEAAEGRGYPPIALADRNRNRFPGPRPRACSAGAAGLGQAAEGGRADKRIPAPESIATAIAGEGDERHASPGGKRPLWTIEHSDGAAGDGPVWPRPGRTL